MAEPVKVKVRECACPDKPHNGEGDWVLLAPTLSLEGGLAAEGDMRSVRELPENERQEALNRRWVLTFVKYGAKGWNFRGPEGEELPFDLDVLLSDYALARPIAEKASDLYTEAVLLPFLVRQATRSPTGQTGATTSRRRPQTRKRSRRLSPATTAGSTPSSG